MKENFRKIALTVSAVLSSLGAYMFSRAGITAATLGSLTAVTAFAVEKKKVSKNNLSKNAQQLKQEPQTIDPKIHKKDLRNQIAAKKKEISNHRTKLRQLKKQKKSSAPIVKEHETIIQDLKNDIQDLKKELRGL